MTKWFARKGVSRSWGQHVTHAGHSVTLFCFGFNCSCVRLNTPRGNWRRHLAWTWALTLNPFVCMHARSLCLQPGWSTTCSSSSWSSSLCSTSSLASSSTRLPTWGARSKRKRKFSRRHASFAVKKEVMLIVFILPINLLVQPIPCLPTPSQLLPNSPFPLLSNAFPPLRGH